MDGSYSYNVGGLSGVRPVNMPISSMQTLSRQPGSPPRGMTLQIPDLYPQAPKNQKVKFLKLDLTL